ncbi:hypothetical protein PCE1_002028 [Barthelona sp. PCE]
MRGRETPSTPITPALQRVAQTKSTKKTPTTGSSYDELDPVILPSFSHSIKRPDQEVSSYWAKKNQLDQKFAPSNFTPSAKSEFTLPKKALASVSVSEAPLDRRVAKNHSSFISSTMKKERSLIMDEDRDENLSVVVFGVPPELHQRTFSFFNNIGKVIKWYSDSENQKIMITYSNSIEVANALDHDGTTLPNTRTSVGVMKAENSAYDNSYRLMQTQISTPHKAKRMSPDPVSGLRKKQGRTNSSNNPEYDVFTPRVKKKGIFNKLKRFVLG